MSFSLYLVHFPILFTVSSALLIGLAGILPYGLAALVSTVLGIAATFAASTLFERFIDRPAIRLSRRLSG
jgi:peptidoglycan/LPS O-acetylase OafA/YrhL